MNIRLSTNDSCVRFLPQIAASALVGIAFACVSQSSLAQPPWGDGPPPWMSRDGGGGPPGMPGGSSRGEGGGWGGGWRGSRGEGGRSGFDPSRMLRQLDTNGNQMIDMDEMQGPARFMLDRMARDNPAIDLTKPVPISKITEAMESRMRGGSGRSEDTEETEIPADEDQPLVAGFGIKQTVDPLPGFGKDADKFSVKVEERDITEASDRINRYDKNKDGLLDENELKDGRWADSPMQYDRNKDQKLSKQELAVRYARKRLNAEPSNKENDKPPLVNVARNENEAPATTTDPWKTQAHYRITPKVGKFAKVQGVQGWFTTSDVDGDGQVMMHEFASNWDEATIQEFRRFDTNFDGTITTAEFLTSVKNGVMRGSGGASSSGTTMGTASTTTSTGSGSFDSEGVDTKWIKFLANAMTQLDRDKNFRITVDEWPASNGSFDDTDANKDGVISMVEWQSVRKKRR